MIQWRTQDLSEGQAQSQESSVNTTSDVIANPCFSRGVRGHAPPEIFENRDA